MTPRRRTAPLKVLFIGNSFTARNDLPGLVTRLASAHDKQMQQRLISAGGASLRRHWNAGEAAAAIENGLFDYVVLQEQSTLPIKNAKRMHESIRLFDKVIRAAGSKTVLYLTWARFHQPESQQTIADAYTSMGCELGATVAPVGVVWQAFLRQHDRPSLHDRDQSHPTLAGSYLAACVFFVVFFKQSPVGATTGVEGLSSTHEVLLQNTAWQVCRDL